MVMDHATGFFQSLSRTGTKLCWVTHRINIWASKDVGDVAANKKNRENHYSYFISVIHKIKR